MSSGWIGVDFDGTLAHYDEWRGPDHAGAPIQLMVDRVKGWLAQGKDVRIFTARVSDPARPEASISRETIEKWCELYLGKKLPVTNVKDFGMVELWDDRCIQVVTNTGVQVTERWPDD